MIRSILLASSCSAALILSATGAGAVAPLSHVAGAPITPYAAYQLANDESDASAAGESADGEAANQDSTGTTEDATGAATDASEVGATDQQDSGEPAAQESAADAEEGVDGTGGAHCEQARAATGQPAESASDTTC